MARYRTKDDVDMAWNDTRRRITTELDLQIKAWREHTLNDLLGEAWIRFSKGLETGEVRRLEPAYKQFVGQALAEAVDAKVPGDAP